MIIQKHEVYDNMNEFWLMLALFKILLVSASFKIKQKIAGSAGDDGTKVVKIMVPL